MILDHPIVLALAILIYSVLIISIRKSNSDSINKIKHFVKNNTLKMMIVILFFSYITFFAYINYLKNYNSNVVNIIILVVMILLMIFFSMCVDIIYRKYINPNEP